MSRHYILTGKVRVLLYKFIMDWQRREALSILFMAEYINSLCRIAAVHDGNILTGQAAPPGINAILITYDLHLLSFSKKEQDWLFDRKESKAKTHPMDRKKQIMRAIKYNIF